MAVWRICLLLFALGAGAANAADVQAKPSTPLMIIGFDLQDRPQRTELSLELADATDFRIFTLAGPDRVIIEMPRADWRVSGPSASSGKSLVTSYRYIPVRTDAARFILDLSRPVKIDGAQLKSPMDGAGFRLVVDLSPTTSSDFAAHTGWPQQVQQNREIEDDRHAALPLVVLDAGHGGMDPGTHGNGGLIEKDLALSVARAVKDKLEHSGQYRVKLTRDRDVFIPLRERVQIARAVHGDLFVSLHVDSNEHREIRGASVYTLSPGASDRETANLADKENMSGAGPGLDMADNNPVADAILTDLGQREIMNLSVRLAETIVATLPQATNVHQPLPHRSANFAVLKAPDIPSVLIELGYLTNVQDERTMATGAWRGRVAAAIAEAIDRHFASAPALQPAAAEAKAPSSRQILGVRTPVHLSGAQMRR